MKEYCKNHKKILYFILTGCVFSFVFLIVLIFEKKETLFYQVNQNIAYYIEDENGKKEIKNLPSEKNYLVSVDCSDEANGSWDYVKWGIKLANLKNSRTKCNITLKKYPVMDYNIMEYPTQNGSGIYITNHDNASITAPLNETQKNNLKKSEYRYAGSNPNNYVTFNDELWRLIGLVNTPNGQRWKLVREEKIGNYSWDTSNNSNNNGYGVNEWSQADLMKLLNPGFESESVGGSLYWNRQSGNCYNGPHNVTTACDFKNIGMQESSKNLIDNVIWNTGSNGSNQYAAMNVNDFYYLERSNNGSKSCTEGIYCTDNISRTTTWDGLVGLTYVSDYGYATSGSSQKSRESCLSSFMNGWNKDDRITCRNNSWLWEEVSLNEDWITQTVFALTPLSNSSGANLVFSIGSSGCVDNYYAQEKFLIYPTVYLKENVLVSSGVGTKSNPYVFQLK